MLVTSKIVTFPAGPQACPERSRKNAAPQLPQASKFPHSASHHKYALTLALFFILSLSSAFALPPASPTKSLQIYFVDVEGGQATLFVTPSGQSLLIDTGWPDNNNRDAARIVATAHDAGIDKIDFVLITHYHDDHVGGAPQLAASIPIGAFIDHGENRETADNITQDRWFAYKTLLDSGKFRHIIAKPGDVLPIRGIHAEVISSDGVLIQKPLRGAGRANPACANSTQPAADKTENSRSLGVRITFGKLNILDLGDLTADKEYELMCPLNKIGKVDIYIASHHGFNQSGSAVFVHAIAPRVAVVDNGASKGGSPSALDIIKSSSNLQALWQLHFSEEAGPTHNTATELIANPEGLDAAHYLKLTANPDNTFTVFNSRTNQSKHYPP
jgi:beta-lactamase superfamily II metal-dependent hydrolase